MRKPIIPQRIENDYSRALRKVAGIVGTIIEHHTIIEKNGEGKITKVILAAGLEAVLRHYSSSINPWAKSIATKMLTDVNNANSRYFLSLAGQMSDKLKSDSINTEIGKLAQSLHADQVTLISSLPLEAGKRAQSIAWESASSGKRYEEAAAEIARSGEVTKSRANTIARTEIHKAYATLTQARAKAVNANKYFWRTAGDELVRESHMEMDGIICNFDNPPTLSDGDSYNAGEGINCRCYAEPIIGDN
jgi:SPP1 gp7 family putative phage head morphogenesis protein